MEHTTHTKETHGTPEHTTALETPKRESLAVPIAIVIAASLIAGSIYLSGTKTPRGAQNVAAGIGNGTAEVATKEEFRAVDNTDHIRGNPNAPIVFVEYSDYDCPFCKDFHNTMNRILREYGPSNKVAWVYRHLPLAQLHPNAPKIAIAAECVFDVAGNDAFWKFSDRVFSEKQPQTGTDMSRITEYAVSAGANESEFALCYSSNKTKDRIDASIAEAAKAGARGTPHTFILVGDQKTVINGAQPYEVVKQTVDSIVAQLEG
jgi:protein-disulfide isomerase